MERNESVLQASMENLEKLNENLDILISANKLSSCSFKGSDVNIGNESVYYEKFLLDDLDNYWDELNDRLTVSRMVSDSVIKGMVHAVVEESDERIDAKEAELEILNRKLQSYDNNSTTGSMSTSHHIESLHRLRSAAAGQIHKLKEGFRNSKTFERCDSLGTIVETMFEEANEMFNSVKASMFEQQWKCEFEREINATIIKSSVRSLQDEFEKKLYEQRSLINQLNASWQQKVNELSSMREELDSISRSLSSSDSGILLSYNSLDSFEELSTSKRKDHLSIKENGDSLMKQSEDYEKLMLEVADPSQLKHLSKDELFTHFKTEMINMRRQHDSALQEKTEEIFKLKREFLREKGSSPFKKDKDFELLKKKIPEVVIKLDGILLEKEKLPTVEDGFEEVCSLKQTIDFLLSENQRLRDLLREQRKEVKSLSSQISDAASQMSLHSSTEVKFLQQIKKLKGELKDVKLEASIQSELHGIILKEVIGEKKYSIDELEIEASIAQDVYTTAVRGFTSDGMSTINSIILKYFTEKSSLNALLCEKEKELCIEIEEKRELNETIQSLSTLMKERENYVLETGSTLMQHKKQFDMLNKEIDMLTERVTKQDELILNKKIEFGSMERRVVEGLQQIRQNEMKIKELSGKLGVASNDSEEAEKQKDILHGIIEDKEKKILSFITKEKQQAKLMDSIVKSTVELSKASIDLENKLVENIGRNETRLKMLSRQCRPLVRMANLLPKRALLYKQMLEVRSSNLQKAEAEVDLLGDEVDALLSLLGKIYIALDHYSPILQHYPSVMEILKLVQRELEGDTSR